MDYLIFEAKDGVNTKVLCRICIEKNGIIAQGYLCLLANWSSLDAAAALAPAFAWFLRKSPSALHKPLSLHMAFCSACPTKGNALLFLMLLIP
jgi:hypothetical protein